MPGRWTNLAVLLLWLTSMTWLLATKVLPAWLRGEPPTIRAVEPGEDFKSVVTGWDIFLGEKQIGVSVGRGAWRDDRGLFIQNRLKFAEFPITQFLPPWMRTLRIGDELSGPFGFEVASTLEIGPDQRLQSFRSDVAVEHMSDLIRVSGRVQGSDLEATVSTGDVNVSNSFRLPEDLLLANELSPAARMPGLQLGQKWTQPIYSPLNPPNRPMEILHAEVERRDVLMWHGRTIHTLLVVYREDGGLSLFGASPVRGKVWVDEEGAVLQHETRFMRTRLRFVRQDDVTARQSAENMLPSLYDETASPDAFPALLQASSPDGA